MNVNYLLSLEKVKQILTRRLVFLVKVTEPQPTCDSDEL